MPTEAEVQRNCLAYLRLVGAFAIRVNCGAVRVGNRFIRFTDTPGCPDILAAVRDPATGRAVFVGVEVKKIGGRLRPAQAAALDAIRGAGGLALVVRSVAELEAALQMEGLTA